MTGIMKVSQVFRLLFITLTVSSSNAQDFTSASHTPTVDDTANTKAVMDTLTEEATLDLDKVPVTAMLESSDNHNNNKTNNNSPVQSGPFIDLLGPSLLSLEMVDASSAQLVAHYTNQALNGKKVVGLYFSADWCGPCRKFTPELLAFYKKMNSRKGRKNALKSLHRDIQTISKS